MFTFLQARFLFHILSSCKITDFCFLINFQWLDVKNRAVFLWCQQSHEIIMRIMSNSIDIIVLYENQWIISRVRLYRSSHRGVLFCKKRFLKKFCKIHRKHLCQSLFFNKVAGNFNKKETLAQTYVKFAKFLRTLFYRTHPVAASDCMINFSWDYVNPFF